MAITKEIKGRVILKHDIEAHWLLATNFIPLPGEIIVYDIEVDANGKTLTLPEDRTEPYTYERFKIGDGKTLVGALPFADAHKADMAYVDNAILQKSQVQIITWEADD